MVLNYVPIAVIEEILDPACSFAKGTGKFLCYVLIAFNLAAALGPAVDVKVVLQVDHTPE